MAVGKTFPRAAALANLGLLGMYTGRAAVQELAGWQVGDAFNRKDCFVRAGEDMFNASITGIGVPSAISEFKSAASAAVASQAQVIPVSWKLLAGLMDDSLFAVQMLPDASKNGIKSAQPAFRTTDGVGPDTPVITTALQISTPAKTLSIKG